MSIKKEIFVTRKSFDTCIDITYGTDIFPIELRIADYVLPGSSIAVAYAIKQDKSGELKKSVCEISDNTIILNPKPGFFDLGKNTLQIRITASGKELYTYKGEVMCYGNIVSDDAKEVEDNPTLMEQILSTVGEIKEEVGTKQPLGSYVTTDDFDQEKSILNKSINDKVALEKEERIAANNAEEAERKREIAVERARIDAIAALPQGATSSDFALEDIKVKFNGETADTPGNAVREQTLYLDKKIDDETSRLSEDIINQKESLNQFNGLIGTNILFFESKIKYVSMEEGTWKIAGTMNIPIQEFDRFYVHCGNVTGSTSDRPILINIKNTNGEILNSSFVVANGVTNEIIAPKGSEEVELTFVFSRATPIDKNITCIFNDVVITLNEKNVVLPIDKKEPFIITTRKKGNIVTKDKRYISDTIDFENQSVIRNIRKVVAKKCLSKSASQESGKLDLYEIGFEIDDTIIDGTSFNEILSAKDFTYSEERNDYFQYYTSSTGNCYATIPNVTNVEEATQWLETHIPEFWVYPQEPTVEKIDKEKIESYRNDFIVTKYINDQLKFNYDEFYKVKPPYWIFHLDCARKYFSVNNIKILIDRISEAGFNQFNFHFSEGAGFRIALANMLFVDEDGTQYDLTPCLGGNENASKWYSQNEMDSIINYAKEKNVDIVPSFDIPGHMGRILKYFPQFKSDDENTLDISNEKAVKFIRAILTKYLKYFASRGCKYWNMCFDEIGQNGLGFKTFYDNGDFQKVIDFSEIIIADIKKYGFTPRMFNDGVYYHDDYDCLFDKDVEICVWKGSSSVANMGNPIKIQKCGYKIINWSGALYWVLGNSNLSVTTDYLKDIDLLHNLTKEYWIYPTPTYGATLSIWCDGYASVYPNDNGDYVLSATNDLITEFGKAIKRATF